MSKSNKKEKKGCFKREKSTFYIALAIILLSIIIGFSTIDYSGLNKMINIINNSQIEVDESKLVTNPITNNDFNSAKTKMETSGLESLITEENFFNGNDLYGKKAVLTSDLDLTSQELGAIGNAYLLYYCKYVENNKDTANLLELDITKLQKTENEQAITYFRFSVILKVDITNEISNDTLKSSFPKNLYTTIVFDVTKNISGDFSCDNITFKFHNFNSSVNSYIEDFLSSSISKDNTKSVKDYVKEYLLEFFNNNDEKTNGIKNWVGASDIAIDGNEFKLIK
jgi:hypothetical protein